MIRIVKSSVNTVALTLTEKRTSTADTTYLFEFKSQSSGDKVYCIGVDTSDYPERYNLFSIEEKTNPVAVDAEIELSQDEEFWFYKVYDNENSASNLDPTGLDLLEQGFVKVIGTSTADTVFETGDATYVVFE